MSSVHRAIVAIVIGFALCTGDAGAETNRSSAEQEQEAFYQQYPDLRAHNKIVQTAFEQLKQSGFQAKTVAEAEKAIALKAYELLNQNAGTTVFQPPRYFFGVLTIVKGGNVKVAFALRAKTGTRCDDIQLVQHSIKHLSR